MSDFPRFETFNYSPDRPEPSIDLLPLEGLSTNTTLGLYHFMLRLRRMEEQMMAAYAEQEMRCPIHFCVGEEALPAALFLNLQKEDSVYSHHRTHGYYMARVPSMRGLFAEVYGKAAGASGGLAGSQDISNHEHKFHGGAILAGSVPLATGAAYAFKTRKERHMAVSATGDAATDQGIYWESLNYAALRKLPVLFLVENNYYSTFSPQHKRNASMNIAERAQAFGLHVRSFFGNDVVRCYQEVKAAVDHIRAGKGPVFIETFTYRWNGHVGPDSDDGNNYRPTAELEYWKKLCPIVLLEKRMREQGSLTDALKEKFISEIDAEIKDAFEFAKSGAFPKADAATLEKWCMGGGNTEGDKLLEDEQALIMNHNQDESVPWPY